MEKFCFLVFLIPLVLGQGPCTYISPVGSDITGNGTQTNPYETIAFALLQTEASVSIHLCLEPGLYVGVNNTEITSTAFTTTNMAITGLGVVSFMPFMTLTLVSYPFVTLENLNLTGGSVTITSARASITLSNLSYTKISANWPSTIENAQNTATVTNLTCSLDCTFLLTGNTGTVDNFQITNAQQLNNSYLFTTINFNRVTVSQSRGQAISAGNCLFGTLTNSVFTNNTATTNLVTFANTEVTVSDTTFENNQVSSGTIIVVDQITLAGVTFGCNNVRGSTAFSPIRSLEIINPNNVTVPTSCPIACQEGSYSVEPLGECLVCAPGFKAPSSFSPAGCIPCPSGMVSDSAGYGCYNAALPWSLPAFIVVLIVAVFLAIVVVVLVFRLRRNTGEKERLLKA